jgi:MFS family permease
LVERVVGKASATADEPGAALKRAAWTMVGLCMVGTMCCSTSVVLVNTGVFIRPLGRAMGWGRGEVTFALSVAAVSMALANPFVGRLIDHFGVKPVLIGSLVGFGATAAATPTLIGLFGPVGLYVGFGLIAAIGAGSNVIAYVRVLSGWFAGPMDGSRGLALGIAGAGVPLGGAVSSPLAVKLIDMFGWRAGFWGLAVIPILIGLPIAIIGVRMADGETGGARAALSAGRARAPGLSLAEAARTLPFWLMIAVVLLMSSSLQGIQIQTPPLLSDRGITPNGLAIVLAATSILGIVGRVGSGFLFDRFFAPLAAVGIFGVAAVAAFILVGLPGLFAAIAATMMLPLGSGAESDFVGYLVGRYYGLRAYAEIFGWVYGMFMVGIAIGPFLFGLAFDYFGSYRIPFIFAGCGLSLICLVLLFMPRFEKIGAGWR